MEVTVVWCVAVWCSLTLTLAGAGQQGGLLTLRELTPHRIRGSYFTGTEGGEGGLHLDIDTSDKHHSLTISTLDGRKVLGSKQHSLDSPLGISLLDNHFILARDQDTKQREYVLPQDMHRFFEPALRRAGMMTILGNILDEEEANTTRSAAILELLASKESAMLIDMAKALAGTGVTGRESPAAFLLYVLALRAQNLINQLGQMENTLSSKATTRATFVATTQMSSDRATAQDAESCDNCPVGMCPLGDKCTGLCGTECDCWEWVCGNCCYNKLCYDHDLCCGRDGYVSWSCLGILSRDTSTGFDCSVAYSCEMG